MSPSLQALAPRLTELAALAIAAGLHGARPPGAVDLTGPLAEPGATFVTLKLHGELRGCIGSLRAWRSLGDDVTQNAYAAAFEDPRFPPLRPTEVAELTGTVALLSPEAPIAAADGPALLAALRPGVDGLVIEDHGRRATFLPAVWAQLPDPAAFLEALKRKAGLPQAPSPTLRARRYTTQACALEGLAAHIQPLA